MNAVGRCLMGVAAATPLPLAACGRGDARVRVRDRNGSQDASFSPRDTTPLGPGDIRITNADSAIDLALIGDSIVTGFGSKVIDKVRDKTDTAAVSGNALGASIEKFVKSTVADAMSHEIKYSITNVSDVKYEGGKLQFFATDGSNMHLFDGSHERGKPPRT